MRRRPVVLMTRREKPTRRKPSDATPRRRAEVFLTFKPNALGPKGEHPTLGPRCKVHGTQVRRLRRKVGSRKRKVWSCRGCERMAA